MRAAVIHGHGGPDALSYVADFPDPRPAAGEVVLEVACSSLNYHDIFTRNGMPGIAVPMPMIMGIDLAGTVREVGEGVTDFKAGDRVLVDPVNRSIGGGLIGETRHGGLAELCAVPAEQLIALPDDVDFEAAASLPVAYGTAYRMMVARGGIAKGERVLILGASGGVGTCCVQLAKLAGAEVVVAASSQTKLDKLKELGADHGINYAEEDFMKGVFSRFGKPARRTFEGGVDVVVNFTGGDTWVKSLRCLRRGGRLLTCGATAGFDPKEDIRFIWTYELDIKGSNGWSRQDLVDLIAMVQKREIRPVIDAVLPLDKAAEAIRLIEDREVFGKVLVKP
jgi:NADPH:quinone reductase-like Zn-dependent oxidoreductase